MVVPQARIVTPVTWMFAPEWLTVQEACDLSGHDRGTMLHIIETEGVDAERDGDSWLIEKESLWEFQEALALFLHWDD
jgi:excisionase family DNA binding protein